MFVVLPFLRYRCLGGTLRRDNIFAKVICQLPRQCACSLASRLLAQAVQTLKLSNYRTPCNIFR